jgi:hypothetical protein
MLHNQRVALFENLVQDVRVDQRGIHSSLDRPAQIGALQHYGFQSNDFFSGHPVVHSAPFRELSGREGDWL